MKREYSSPRLVAERFQPNEYVAAACGKTPTGKYIFVCDAPAGVIHYYDSKGNDINRKKNYRPCGATHITNGPGSYYKGYVDRNNNRKEDAGEAALIWLEPVKWGTDGHASASLTMETVDTVRS